MSDLFLFLQHPVFKKMVFPIISFVLRVTKLVSVEKILKHITCKTAVVYFALKTKIYAGFYKYVLSEK